MSLQHTTMNKIDFVFFGSSKFSEYVLKVLKEKGFEPKLCITSAKGDLPEIPDADLYIVASFGKILKDELINRPRFKTLNVHPSLLPHLRGPAPIQGAILNGEKTGVSIMRMNAKMDQGPVLAMKEVTFENIPEHYSKAEEVLGTVGGELLVETMIKWVNGEINEIPQDDSLATYTKLIKKENSDITNDIPEIALRKIRAYEIWPRARLGELIVTDAHIENGELILDKVIPPGKREMAYKDYLRGKH